MNNDRIRDLGTESGKQVSMGWNGESVFVRRKTRKMAPTQLETYLGFLAHSLGSGSLVISNSLVLKGSLTLVEGSSSTTSGVVSSTGGSTSNTATEGTRNGVVGTSANRSSEVARDGGKHGEMRNEIWGFLTQPLSRHTLWD